MDLPSCPTSTIMRWKSQVGIQRQNLTREPEGPCNIRDRALALKPELRLNVPPDERFSHLVLLGLSFLTCKWGNFSWFVWRSKVITTTKCCVDGKNSINRAWHLILLQNRDRDLSLFISTSPVFDYHSFYPAIPSSSSFFKHVVETHFLTPLWLDRVL